MLEILSHQYLKKFVNTHSMDWEHIYSFGRIISKCIENNKTYLINSEIFSTNDWMPAILIALFLKEENSIFVLPYEKIEFIKNNQIKDLESLGFNFVLKKDQIIFLNHKVFLITLKKLLSDPNFYTYESLRIVLTGIEDIKQSLKNHFKISLYKKDWFENSQHSEKANPNIISKYNFLKNKFLTRRTLGSRYLYLDKKEVGFLSDFFEENALYSEKFSRVSRAIGEDWACWVEIENTKLEWALHLEPMDELSLLTKCLSKNKFVFLSALRRDNFFQEYLERQSLYLDLVINFKSNFNEKKILLYVPPKQILPNNPSFASVILDNCKKLAFFRNGLTLVLSDDGNLKNKLATQLASVHGKRVLLETIPFLRNQILCASYNWWINNSHLIENPEQIILPLLPIPNMYEPINVLTVSFNKKLSRDWFKEFLLPEATLKLERAISPLRRNSGKLIILDGRASKRQWGRSLLRSIQPSEEIKYILPFD